ncbi:hypothetical protein DI272_19075 [Streptomyces sp. Act143]|uniref:hypothetical protein n=1 Tax=Streptomyces sp. Act143 TaxID=2200760 RepID=UPI000D675804|nr:hypothetical protein [Streptomyces sp. Act143]PWI16035.1 hypothetical protein DI272_19075 [Streptomyces sp. Act143]
MPLRAARFASTYAALTAAHEIGDYWAQQDKDAITKGHPGPEGAQACLRHVAGYTTVQALALITANHCLGLRLTPGRIAAGLTISALTHYAADRGMGRWTDPSPAAPPVVRLAHATGHTGWLTRDPAAGPLMDQAWHKGWIAVAALVAAVGRTP